MTLLLLLWLLADAQNLPPPCNRIQYTVLGEQQRIYVCVRNGPDLVSFFVVDCCAVMSPVGLVRLAAVGGRCSAILTFLVPLVQRELFVVSCVLLWFMVGDVGS